MTFQSLSLSVANDGLGDPLRDGGAKINSNFLLAQALFDTLSAGLANETGSASAAEATLQGNIDTVSTNLNNNVGSLSNRINVLSTWVASVGRERNFNVYTTDHTLALADFLAVMDLNCASPSTVTIPLHSAVSLGVGAQIDWLQDGPGQISFVASGTLHSSSGYTKSSRQYAMGMLLQTSTDVWVLAGDIGA